ncbi:TrfB transcriptional repressor protein [Neisseria bacilliformis ATCC BAA-1200]|uniref:TrfB transcriptional repressor protein n=1 Tax=Neisseria bacilliformis ATCC BAA-1200 TaxID=888742 RepID=F2BC73_9NEIS|nr:TrfB transcriptional repressor protein [Neisseria bacilliformis ATCC BAA-1200]
MGIFQTASAAWVGCVAQATHAVWGWRQDKNALCGMERVRRWGDTPYLVCRLRFF